MPQRRTVNQPMTNSSLSNLQQNQEAMICKFLIEPPIDNSFIVPKRIIGPKGKNMKQIISACKKSFGKKVSKLIKIRLRGKNSGYLEGINQQESQEQMQVCISCKFLPALELCCQHVHQLLARIRRDFHRYSTKYNIKGDHMNFWLKGNTHIDSHSLRIISFNDQLQNF